MENVPQAQQVACAISTAALQRFKVADSAQQTAQYSLKHHRPRCCTSHSSMRSSSPALRKNIIFLCSTLTFVRVLPQAVHAVLRDHERGRRHARGEDGRQQQHRPRAQQLHQPAAKPRAGDAADRLQTHLRKHQTPSQACSWISRMQVNKLWLRRTSQLGREDA
jgi:hypothetical protein